MNLNRVPSLSFSTSGFPSRQYKKILNVFVNPNILNFAELHNMKEKANILKYLMGNATQRLVSIIFKVNYGLLYIVNRPKKKKLLLMGRQ